MRVLLQRVTGASVRVEDAVVGRIDGGLLALVGIGHGDTLAVVQAMADRTVGLRIFRDAAGRTNRSLLDVGGELLAVSQFTLYADTHKGRRPSFLDAASPSLGSELYQAYADAVAAHGIRVACGRFGAEMAVELTNDGPFTIWLDSEA